MLTPLPFVVIGGPDVGDGLCLAWSAETPARDGCAGAVAGRPHIVAGGWGPRPRLAPGSRHRDWLGLGPVAGAGRRRRIPGAWSRPCLRLDAAVADRQPREGHDRARRAAQ